MSYVIFSTATVMLAVLGGGFMMFGAIKHKLPYLLVGAMLDAVAAISALAMLISCL